MDAYAYRAALYCERCAKRIMDAVIFPYEDSDRYPQGPHCDGGGEADGPQHCDACNMFLENSLTLDGEEYVREAIARAMANRRPTSIACTIWAPFYGMALDDSSEES